MIVVDASALLDLLLRTEAAQRVIQRLFSSKATWHAPHVVDLEVAQVLRRYVAAGALAADAAQAALADFALLPIERYPHEPLLPRIWELRHNMTAYDAAYVALAEALRAPLVTTDGRLARASGHHASIEAL